LLDIIYWRIGRDYKIKSYHGDWEKCGRLGDIVPEAPFKKGLVFEVPVFF